MANSSSLKALQEKYPDVKLLQGTDPGPPTYFILARQGDMAIGVKAVVVMDGAGQGVPNSTYVGCRMRAARSDNYEVLHPAEIRPDEVWELKWEKADENRASLHFGYYMDGSAKSNPEVLTNNLKDGSLGKVLTETLVQLIGDEHLIYSKEKTAELMQDMFAGYLADVQTQISAVLDKVPPEYDTGMIGKGGTADELHAKIMAAKKAKKDAEKSANPSFGEEVEDIDFDDDIALWDYDEFKDD